MQELKSSGGVLYSVQTTLPEAGGRVGEVPVAVSWEWLPGAPCGSICCCEGRPACEFVGPYRLLGLCPQRWGAVASGLPKQKEKAPAGRVLVWAGNRGLVVLMY